MTHLRTSISLTLVLLVFASAPVAFAAAPTAASFSTIVPANRQSAVTLQGADSDGTALVYAITSGPSHGALSSLNTATGVVVYTPVANFTGADSFTYTVTSGGDTTAAATVTLTVSNAKTRIVDSVVDSSGVARSGKVTFILTQAVASPDGLTPAGSSVSASLLNGVFDISVFPSRSLSPNAYYQVYWSDASTTNKELLGIFDIPLSTSTVTLAAYKVMDTNLAARYTFASTAAVQALTTAVSNATVAQLLSVSRTTGKLQKWDGGNLTDSIISESGSTVTVNGTLSATNITGIKSSDLPAEITGKTFKTATLNSPTVKTPTIENPTITGAINGNQSVVGDLVVSGKVSGDGSLLTNVVSAGVGGTSSLSTLTLRADSDNSGSDGDISVMPGNTEALRFKADGRVTGTRRITGEALLSEYAIPDDGLDDSVGFQTALNAVGAGTINTIIIDGEYKIARPVVKNFSGLHNVLRIRGRGARSILHIATGTGTTAVTLSNLERLEITSLNGRGTSGVSTDAKVAFAFTSIKRGVLRDVDLFGVSNVEAGGAVVRLTGSDFLFQSVNFRGCSGAYATLTGLVDNVDFIGFRWADSDMIDHGTLNGVYYSKTGTNPYYWIKLGEAAQASEGKAIIENAYFDEGASYALISSQVSRPAYVTVRNVTHNMNATELAYGFEFGGSRYVSMQQVRSQFGQLGTPPVLTREMVRLTGVHTAIIEQVQGYNYAKKIVADSTTQSLILRGVTIDTLESNAVSTRVEGSTISSFAGTGQFEVHGAGKRIFGGTVLPSSYATEFRGGGINVTGLPAVTGLIAAANVASNTTWTYYVIAVDAFGRRTTAASYVLTQGWPADVLNLSGGAWHAIAWNAVPGAASYLVFRNNTATLLGSTTSTSWIDGGETPSNAAYVANMVNETAPIVSEGYIQANTFKIGAVSWTSGAGAPTGSCVTGSHYSRTDGGAGSTSYVCEASEWVVK